jgi:mannan endo-1,4-beta-mannosidase
VHMLVQKFGRAAQGGVKFYALDNEPALWPTTHPRVHPEKTTYAEIVARTEALASVITELDPTATVVGGVMFGWSEFTSLSSAPDSKQYNAKYGTYIDYYLASMQRLERKHGRRLVHVLDVHWYPEVRGAKRITEEDASRKTIDARLAAPRSLWDPTYKERSWITDQTGKPIRLFRWLKEKIAERYPGTELAMTEYNYGGTKHISGGLAQADVLGIFGREGLLLANYWGKGAGVGELPAYIAAAYRLYRNYDGKGGRFGDTAVAATVEDLAKASVYAATDSQRPGVLTLVVINKDQRGIFQGRFKIGGPSKYRRAQVFSFGPKSPEIRPQPAAQIKNNELLYALQPLSATLFVCTTR